MEQEVQPFACEPDVRAALEGIDLHELAQRFEYLAEGLEKTEHHRPSWARRARQMHGDAYLVLTSLRSLDYQLNGEKD